MQQKPSQADLWSNIAENWRIQEEGAKPVYEAIIATIDLDNKTLLDAGCGTGFFLSLAAKQGAVVTGIDLSDSQVNTAQKYLTSATFRVASTEDLPFADDSFDYVAANNSVQFCPNPDKALKEIYRVLKPGGTAIITLWDEPQKSDAFSYFKVFYSITGEPLETSIPFNLSGNGVIEGLLQKAGFKIAAAQQVIYPRIYPDIEIALKGILASGPAINAISQSSKEVVEMGVTKAIQPFIQPDGSYKIHNAFVFTTAVK
ncbi:MAG: class I SAM-dependent methyltransferase [Bacteroidetes bacterium]|nr:class I SAM-dependent methyltransferase [Bacteroidota bacterium]